MSQQKYYYTWSQFDKDCQRIAYWAQQFQFKNIYGIPRSGLIVAGKLAHMLDLPIIQDPHDIDPKETLVVDDVIRTGQTVAALEEHIGDVVIATLVREGDHAEPDFYARQKDEYVIFPWEQQLEGLDRKTLSRVLATAATVDVLVKTDKEGLA